ncbi:MAG: hypothetical protein DRI44_03290 [Chlamydiae bacterium]|nr:MAG: hypothetical protein DRI44_03290 [Chlamydiota bacterium]
MKHVINKSKFIEYGLLILVLLVLLFLSLCSKTHINDPAKIKKFLLYKASNTLEKTILDK